MMFQNLAVRINTFLSVNAKLRGGTSRRSLMRIFSSFLL
jgi:hypothetical protein